MQLTLKYHLFSVSQYDPDSPFYISSLISLEAAGIKVVTALQHNLEYLKIELGLYDHSFFVQHVIEQWEVRGQPPRTWRSLLHIISQGMNLTGLSQQIEDYLQHGGKL